MSDRRREKQDSAALLTFLALLALVLAPIALLAAPYLLSILMGAILALMSRPAYRSLERLGLCARWAALLVTLGGLLLIIAPLAAFLTLALKQAVAVGQQLAGSEDLTFKSLADKVGAFGPLRSLLRDSIQGAAKVATGLLLKAAANIPLLLVQVALACLAWFFLLRDGQRFLAWVMEKLPLDADVRDKLIESFKNMALSTVWATLAAACAQAMVMSLGFLLLGIPSVFLAAGCTFILSWFPVVGSVPVSLAAVLYLYAQGAYLRMGLMGGLGFVVTVVDNVVRPWVLKGREDLHPLVSLVAIIAGIQMFGIPGAFLGPILVSLGISLLDLWPLVAHRYGVNLGSAPESLHVGDRQ